LDQTADFEIEDQVVLWQPQKQAEVWEDILNHQAVFFSTFFLLKKTAESKEEPHPTV
jgi:hypothetical protein